MGKLRKCVNISSGMIKRFFRGHDLNGRVDTGYADRLIIEYDTLNSDDHDIVERDL